MAAAKKERHIVITEQIAQLSIAPALQMMYAEVAHLSRGKGYCYANNKHFEELFRKSDSCISKWVKALEKKKLVFRLVIRSAAGTERRLYINESEFKKAQEEHGAQSLTGRQNVQPGVSESTTGGCTELPPGVVKNGNPGCTGLPPGVVQSYNHNITVNNTGNTTGEYISSTEVEENVLPGGEKNQSEERVESEPASLAQQEEEKEKGSAEKEKEESIRTWYQRYKDAWFQFYRDQNNGKEPPYSWIYPAFWGGLKKIQQDLSAEFEGNEERAYQEFAHILSGWQHPKNYHRNRLKPESMHRNLEEIRAILRDNPKKVLNGGAEATPYLEDALQLYKSAFQELKHIPPNINGKGPEHMAGILNYIKTAQPGNTWEQALQGFEHILRRWPELEKQDSFYANNFTLSYINGNTSRIITTLKAGQHRHQELTVDAAEAWLARNGLGA